MSSHRKLLALLVTASSLAVFAPAAVGSAAPAEPASALRVEHLRTDDTNNPLGIDDTAPKLSWQLSSPQRNQLQTAYQIEAASSADALQADRPDLWDTGKVVSSKSIGVDYAGAPLRSRERVYWRVRAWDRAGSPSPWSDVEMWEMGLLKAADWTAQWIGNPQWEQAMQLHPIVVRLPAHDSRYVRLEVSKLVGNYLQLAEVVVRDGTDPSTDLAKGAAVSASEQFGASQRGQWEPQYLTDGQRNSSAEPRGYSSTWHAAGPLANPIRLDLDLGAVRHFDEVLIYPRTDSFDAQGNVTQVPADYTVQIAASADGPFTVVTSVTGQQPPSPASVPNMPLPDFARQFDLGGNVRSARLYAVGLGLYEATVNGQPVSGAVLDQDYTDYDQRVTYATYDVTRLLQDGANSLGFRLGNGYYNVPYAPSRSALISGWGPPKLLAQLEISYADGHTQTIATDPSWRTRLGATTSSHWWGGEEFDARRMQTGWDEPGAELSSWAAAVPSAPPMPDTKLSAMSGPPIQPVGTIRPVKVTEPKPGVYVFDFGVNFAGWEELHVHGPTGTTITMRPAEMLTAQGTVNQITGSMGGDVHDAYTLAGTGDETWHPDFVYHGFRYLQVEGLTYLPTLATVSGIVLRTANQQSTTFDSSDAMLNDIHAMINRAVQNNMYAVMTDCPNREKRGWLEEDQLIYGVLTRNYDVAAYSRKIVRDMSEAMTPDGLVRNTAPSLTGTSDPNWGGALVLTPWQMYQTYGDVDTLRTYYPDMQRYMTALATLTDGYLYTDQNAYGDWGATDTSTPKNLATTFGYLRLARAMSDIARVLGKDSDAADYSALAQHVADAFNAAYFHPGTDSYASGSQASDALALDLGIVPAAHQRAVTDNLIASIRDDGDRYTVGEIALPSLFRVLAAAGQDQLIYQMAVQAGSPGYGYALVNGATALPSYPDSTRMLKNSQSHWMMGALDSWFTTNLGGIQAAPGAVGYHKLVIAPHAVGSIAHADSSYATPYGTVRSDWNRTGDAFHLNVTVPVNTTATVEVPLFGNPVGAATGGAKLLRIDNDRAVYGVGSGTWTFVSTTQTPASSYGGNLALAAPDHPVGAATQVANPVAVTAFNLSDQEITVTPQVTATAGFAARLDNTNVVVPAHGSVAINLTVQRTDDTTPTGTATVQVQDRAAQIQITGTDDLARLATMTASSTHSGWSPAATNDGDTTAQHDYTAWDAGQGWNDNTNKQFPDTLTATWTQSVPVSRVVVYTLDAISHPASQVGLRDYDVQARVEGTWQTVAQVRGNTQGTITFTFPKLQTDAMRLVVQDSNDHSFSRVVELEVY